MQEQRNASLMLKLCSILLLLPALIASVPTSVLVQNSELSATNNDIASLNDLKTNKVKRSSHEANGISSTSTVSAVPANNDLEKKSSPEVVPAPFNSPPPRRFQDENTVLYGLPDNSEAFNEHAHNFEDEPSTSTLYKRGINEAQQRSYGGADGFYSNPFLSSSMAAAQLRGGNGGVWADELDPVSSYSDDDLQELDDYTPVQRAPSYRKSYYNLQNLLNTDGYMEPVALPYSGRYYGVVDEDRQKRSNPSKLDRYAELRSSKRDAKLTPADMLALVALVEAGERARKESDPESNEQMYPTDGISFRNSFANNPDLNDNPIIAFTHGKADDIGTAASFYDSPASVVDYFGAPLKVKTFPKYDVDVPHDHYKYGGRNRLSVKRFMVAKKSRPYGKFLNGPIAKPSLAYLNIPIDETFN